MARITKPAAAAAAGGTSTNVIVIGAGTSANFGRSSDFGATWTFGTIPGITLNNKFQICCGNVNSAPLWVFVGSTGTMLVSFNTTNGTTWSSISNSISSIITNSTTSTYCTSLAFGNGVFMASGFTGVYADGAPVAISADGITWSNGGTPHPNKLTNAVTFGNGYWVAVPNQGVIANNVMMSTNVSIANVGSITWSAANTIPNDPLYSVLYNGSKWFVGYYGKLYYSASNLPTSSFAAKGFTPTGDIAYTLSYSPNGTLVIGTQNAGGGGTSRVYKIDFGSTSTFIATGGGGGIYTLNTTDVVNSDISLNGSAYFSGNKAVISTDNGTSWTAITGINTNLTTGCYGVAFAK